MAKKKDTKETSTALVEWEKEFENLAKESKKGIETSDGKFISFSGGKMTFGGADIEGNELECVIVGWTHHNVYYDPKVAYNPKTPQAPICYAYGTETKEMVPHDAAPQKQCGSCAECPFNQFESDPKGGRGKACKNTFRLAVIASSDLDDLANAEVVYVPIPPTSTKNFSNYLGKDLDKLKRPFWSVVTRISRVPDDTSQFKVTFKMVESINDAALFQPLKDLWKHTMEGLPTAYPVRDAVAAEKPKGKQKFARR